MKKIKKLLLEVQKPGMPQYVKQSIEISDKGFIKQILYPMVYLGQMKIYDYSVDIDDIERFFSTLDFDNWNISKTPSSTSFSFNLNVLYEDNEYKEIFGYIFPEMPEEYQNFDEKLLELVLFIERPWLFTI